MPWASSPSEASYILDLHKSGTALGGRKPIEEVACLLVRERVGQN
jgi:hypothetical protein